jgi:Spherulation-specific family 4
MKFKKALLGLLLGVALTTNAFATGKQYEMLVPSYYGPNDNVKWEAIVNASKIVPVTAIINPNSGPGTSVDANWISRIGMLRSAGVKVLGYVATGYGGRNQGAINADLQNFASWYNIDGYFIDEVAPEDLTVAGVNLYANIVSAAKSLVHSSAKVVLNPGINFDQRLLSVANADVVVGFEDKGSNYSKNIQANWSSNYSASRFADLVYSQGDPTSAYKNLATRNVKYVYITSDGGSNPWDTAASYIIAEATILAALNAGQTVDFDVPVVTYDINRVSKFDRAPAIYQIKPLITGGLSKERALTFAVKIDGTAINTKGKLPTITFNSGGQHDIEVTSTTPKGKVMTSTSSVNIGANQPPRCTFTDTLSSNGKSSYVKLNCTDPDGKIADIKWFRNFSLLPKSKFPTLSYAPYTAGVGINWPSIIASVTDDSGETINLNIREASSSY